MYKVDQTGIITFGDKTTSRVRISRIQTYRSLPSDIIFSYLDEETHRPLINKVLETNFNDEKDSFNLPEGLAHIVFKLD